MMTAIRGLKNYTKDYYTMQNQNQTPTGTSRRDILKGAIAGAAGATGLAVAGTALWTNGHAHAAKASSSCTPDSAATILAIAATAEQLAVTFYTHGINNAHKLGISGQNLNYLTGAVVEEQYHLNLLVAAGGKPVTGTFSFPYGMDTFEHLGRFIHTLDQLETAFESAYIAAIRDFALLNLPDYAVLAGQIATVEAEHRALGRSIDTTIPTANNWAFTPVYVKSVADAANVLAAEGYLSPKSGNSYMYAPVSLTLNKDVTQTTPYVVACS
ncbi:MAG: hypothetical protein NVSMB38_01890 [Ktedonobacteraceae bacterium]